MSSRACILNVATGLLLFFAVASMAAVCERVLGAVWQAFKFQGYATPGLITLNTRTAVLFVVSSAIVISTSVLLRRHAIKHGSRSVRLLAGAAACISAASLGAFVVLSVSPLNSWL